MTVEWDPKVRASGGGAPSPTTAPRAKPGSAAPLTDLPETPRGMEVPVAAKTHPTRRAPDTAPGALDKLIEELRHALRGPTKTRQGAAAEALRLAQSALARRARGSRRAAVELLDAVAEALPSERPVATQLRAVLVAEDDLQDLTGDATLRAIATLVTALEDEEP